MSGIINIEEHNKKVSTIDDKKRAIEEASKLAVDTLESNKPNLPSLSCGDFELRVETINGGQWYGFKAYINGNQLSYYDNFRGSREWLFLRDVKKMQNISACIIKAFGPIPQELIDSVEVK